MKNNITELVFILDRSGSMAGLESDTIGGFNAMIEKQKRLYGKCYVTTLLFNDATNVIHDRVSLEKVRPMTHHDYHVSGCTALLDAIGYGIRQISTIHRYIRPEDVPQRTLFVIMTDGMENASHRYTYEGIRNLIDFKKKKLGWEFLFIGANMDAIGAATSIGISADRAVNYHADGKGTSVAYEAVNDAVYCVRAAAPLAANWSDKINADYQSRK